MLDFLFNITQCPICHLNLEEGEQDYVDVAANVFVKTKIIYCASVIQHYHLTEWFLTINVLDTICMFNLEDNSLLFLTSELHNNQQLKDNLLSSQSFEQFKNKLATYLNFS